MGKLSLTDVNFSQTIVIVNKIRELIDEWGMKAVNKYLDIDGGRMPYIKYAKDSLPKRQEILRKFYEEYAQGEFTDRRQKLLMTYLSSASEKALKIGAQKAVLELKNEADEKDYEYAKKIINEYYPKSTIIMMPVYGTQIKILAERVLRDCLNVRVMPQLHKLIWGEIRGV